MRAGNISGSLNVPFASLVNPETGCMKSNNELRAVFEKAGVDYTKKTIHSCGSGVTACIVQMAYEMTGGRNDTMYDGSWSEYVSLIAKVFHVLTQYVSTVIGSL